MDNVSLNGEKDALRDKMRSYSTLNSLYHETRLEMDLLNKQNRVKDNIIADLKARLGKYERIYMTVGNSESVVVGPSKSLLESLCKEICKQKQKIGDMERKAEQQAEVRMCSMPRMCCLLQKKRENELRTIRSEGETE